MLINWHPRGHHTYHIIRGCIATTPTDDCNFGNIGGAQFKECYSSCDPHSQSNGCNDGIDAVAEHFFNPNGVTECYSCNHTHNKNGIVDGIDSCGVAVPDSSSIKCPTYATTSCFHATSRHPNYKGDGDFTDVFRGCSPFLQRISPYCEYSTLDTIEHYNCRETCNENKCNDGTIPVPMQCITCQSTRGSDNTTISGERACWDESEGVTPAICDSADDVCTTELLVDWLPTGTQQATIRRGCGIDNGSGTCTETISRNIQQKSCLTTCTEKDCNTDLEDISSLLSSKSPVQSCFMSSYDGEDMDGLCSANCKHERASCPSYANSGCYIGTNVHQTTSQVFRGCSSFSLDISPDCSMEFLDDSIAMVCKEYCTSDECNEAPPTIPEPPSPEGRPACQKCLVMFDQENNTIGIGDDSCIEGDSSLTEKCPNSDDICQIVLEINWNPRGHHSHIIKRGCARAHGLQTCQSAETSGMAYKYCDDVCDPKADGDGCNDGLDQVSKHFYNPDGVTSCYSCQYYQDFDGNDAVFL